MRAKGVSRQTFIISGQHLRKRATFLTTEGNSALLPASTRDQTVIKTGMIMERSMFTSSARHVIQTVFHFHEEET